MRQAIFDGLDVPVEHRRVAVHAEFVRDPVHVDPRIRAELAPECLLLNPIVEHLRAASRKRSQPRLLQIEQHAPQIPRPFADPSEMYDFHSGERLDVDSRRFITDRPAHVGVVRKRQVWVQAADDVDLRRPGVARLRRPSADLIDAHLVRTVVAPFAGEFAEAARERTDVRVVHVLVDVVVGPAAMQASSDLVRQIAHRPDIGRLKQYSTFIERQTLTRLGLRGDGVERRIGFDRTWRDRGHDRPVEAS